ncbi:MAG: KpsF/GutQ family sugar-phosphate isomerase [Alphaproteobacteria bacterium]|jgi:arabinose-5-phosphate isomerase|nr:KpsF/GutQ family sugar-phosphate isomerase [Alphaproteobacteria bacterium]
MDSRDTQPPAPDAAPLASVPAASAGDADRAAGARLLEIEAAALRRLATVLDARFTAALDALAGTGGRVVVTGIGKSGHIANKVASTFASTGTPAFFVHPSEASHGDLGMIAPGDVVLMFSNSGGSTELADLVAHTRRFENTLIAVTSNEASPLAEQADIVLLLPAEPEACPMGLAPTTSTTMMLALGDALAIALLNRRGFSPEDFRVLHPGGRLGRHLIKVGDIMHGGESLPLARPDQSMAEVILMMTAKSFGCVGLVDGTGTLCGIITDGDLRRHMAGDLLRRRAAEIMTRQPRTIRAGALAAEAVTVMNRTAITSLFIVDEARRPIGILHIHDCLRAGLA